MKKLLFLSMVIALIASCSSGPRYVLEGQFEGMDDGMLYLQKAESGKLVKIDSASIQDGSFQLTGGSLDYPDIYYLTISGKRGYLELFLENTRINISGHADSLVTASVEGSATNDKYDEYNDGMLALFDRNRDLFDELRAARQAGDEEKVKELEERRNLIYEESDEYAIDFIKANPESYATPRILQSMSYNLSAEELQSYIDQLDPKLLETKIIMNLQDMVEKLRRVAVGEIAPDFTQNDPDGNPVSLSEVLGPEVLLVDFWAAWCGPCRQENPNVVAVYNEFNDRGFDVLGVSLDSDRDAWLKAIEDDSLTWTHVSDLRQWENEAARLYAVNAIPANFLLDSEGKILATNVRGPELRKKVVEILGE